MFLRFKYLLVHIHTSLLLLLIVFHARLDHNLFIHSPLDGHLGCTRFLPILKWTAINILLQVFLYVFIALEKYLRVEFLGHKRYMFNFIRNWQIFLPKSLYCFHLIHKKVWDFRSSTCLPTLGIVRHLLYIFLRLFRKM